MFSILIALIGVMLFLTRNIFEKDLPMNIHRANYKVIKNNEPNTTSLVYNCMKIKMMDLNF